MADLAGDPETPTLHNDDSTVGFNDGSKSAKRQRPADDDDDDDGDGKGRERRKIDIKFINDKSRRHITFSKRKAGIMKKAYELSVLTGTQVLLLVVSETGLVYTFTTPKLQPLVTKAEGKNLIQACLNAPSPTGAGENGLEEAPPPVGDADEAQAAVQGMSRGGGMGGPPPGYPNMTPQELANQYYLQQSQQQQAGMAQYPPVPQMKQ